VEVLKATSQPFPSKSGDIKEDAGSDVLPGTTTLPHRPRNSFLVRITNKKKKKRRGGKRSGRKKGRHSDFMKKLQKDAEEGKVECYQIDDGQKGTHERQLSHKDLKKMVAPVVTVRNRKKLPDEFQSSPAIRGSRTSYLMAKKTLSGRNLHNSDEKNQDKASTEASKEDNNAQIVKVQSEYIEALESEVKRSKVRADLLTRSLNMEIKRMQDLIAKKDKAINHKELILQSLKVQNLNLEKEIAQKDNIIDIQGQYISGLEMENAELNRRLSENEISPVARNQQTNNLQNMYRRVSVNQY